MVKHIVIWKIQDSGGRTAAENAAAIKQGLEGLVGRIDGLLSARVTFGFSADYNCMLESEFSSREALAAYREHPEHKKVQQLVHSVMEKRASFDAEL